MNHIPSNKRRFRGAPGGALRALSLGTFVCCLFAISAEAQGTETYTYPGISLTTQFTISNVNDIAVSVDVTFYRGSTGESIQHVEIINSGLQTELSAESIGITSFDGTAVISADLPLAITASVVDPLTAYDYRAPSLSSTELIIPLVSVGQSLTDLSVFNPGTQDARARVILVNDSGIAQSFNDRLVGPKRTVTLPLSQLASAVYAVVRTSNFFLSGTPVSAAARVRNFDPPDGTPNRLDIAHISGVPAPAEPTSGRIPLFRQGGGLNSTLQVINDSNSPQTVTLTALDPVGAPIEGDNNPATVTLDARSALTQTVDDLFDFDNVELQTGSITIGGSDRVSAAVAIGGTTKTSVAFLPMAGPGVEDFAYHIRQIGRDFTRLLSLHNLSAQVANLQMTFILEDGTVVSSVGTTIPAGTQLIATLAELLPEAQGNGFVLMQSDVPLIGSGLETRLDESANAALRALPASPSFMSDDPEVLFAVGTVHSNGIGLPGTTVRLTGTQTDVTLTDAAGTYVFNDLAPGGYSISAEKIGYIVAPDGDPNIVISTDSSRENDFTATLVTPTITQVTPTAVPFGSPDTVLTVEGGPFIAGSAVFLGTTQLATTVQTSQVLSATAPADLLQASVQYNLRVRNVGLGGDSVDSPPVQFSVGAAPPSLLALSGQPDPLIAGASGFTLTVTGLGFLPGVTVFFDGIPKPAIFLSDTEIQVDIDAADLTEGGFLPVRARNPGPALFSNTLTLTVLNPSPDITSIIPATTQVRLSPSMPPLAITAIGTGFEEGASMLVDSAPVQTQFVSETMVVGTVPSTLLTLSGIRQIQVVNPPPTVGPSFSAPLTLTNPLPVLTTVQTTAIYDPGQAGQLQTAPVLLLGSGFAENSTAWVSLPCDSNGFRLLPNITVPDGQTLPPAFETVRLSPSAISATANLECAGDYEFQIRSPQPGGGVSASVIVSVPSL